MRVLKFSEENLEMQAAASEKMLATAENLVSPELQAVLRRNQPDRRSYITKILTADIIVGPIGIVIADALLGEITPAMAAAVCQSPARRVLVPINHCENIVVGVPDQPIGQLVAAAAQKVKELAETPCK